MKIRKRAAVLLLILALLLSLSACGQGISSRYKILETLDSNVLSVAFRNGDGLRDIVSAAMSELAAEGQLSRLSVKWLGSDYTSLKGEAGSLQKLNAVIPKDRLILVGVDTGAAPMSSLDGGNFTGYVPDVAKLVCDKLGWRLKFIPISSSSVKVELNSGNVDCAWLCASFDANSKDYSVSPGYMKDARLLVVRKDSGISRKKMLEGKAIAVTNDIGAITALKSVGLKDGISAIWKYDNVQGCFDALDQGACAALVVDKIIASHYMIK